MTISLFRGEFEYLSNHWPVLITVDDLDFPSVEHAFQAAKTDDRALKESIQQAATAADAKKIGRSVPLVADWNTKRLDVMQCFVKQKFNDNIDLKLKLLLTGNQELVQGEMRRDDFWGVSRDGSGENHLGKILMRTRDEIRAQEGGAFDTFRAHLKCRGLGYMGDLMTQLFEYACEQYVATNDDEAFLKKVINPLK